MFFLEYFLRKKNCHTSPCLQVYYLEAKLQVRAKHFQIFQNPEIYIKITI